MEDGSTVFLAPCVLSAWPGACHQRELSFAWLPFVTLPIFCSDEETTALLRPGTCPKSHTCLPGRAHTLNPLYYFFSRPVCFTSGSVMGDKAGPANTVPNS